MLSNTAFLSDITLPKDPGQLFCSPEIHLTPWMPDKTWQMARFLQTWSLQTPRCPPTHTATQCPLRLSHKIPSSTQNSCHLICLLGVPPLPAANLPPRPHSPLSPIQFPQLSLLFSFPVSPALCFSALTFFPFSVSPHLFSIFLSLFPGLPTTQGSPPSFPTHSP